MTIKILIIALLLNCNLNTYSQSNKFFEGTISYRYSFKDAKIPNPEKVLTPYIGLGSTLYFKEGNYRHEYDGGMLEYDLYNRTDNKFYFKKRNSDTLFYNDCSVRGDSILNFVYTPKADTVMNIVCDRLAIEYRDKTEIHYYNSDSISIDPEWFKNFKMDDEYLIDKKEKSIFLKSENDLEYFTVISAAEKVSVSRVDMNKFTIPSNVILVRQD